MSLVRIQEPPPCPECPGALPPRERVAAVARVRRAVATAADRRGVIAPGEARARSRAAADPDSTALLDALARLAPTARLAAGGRARRPWACATDRPRDADVVAALAVGSRAARSGRSASTSSPAARSRITLATARHAALRSRGGTRRRVGDRARSHRRRPGGDRADATARRRVARPGCPRWPNASGDWRDRCSASGATRRSPTAQRSASSRSIDPSNADPRFLRSRVRHEVIPALEAVFPGARRRLVVLAERQRRLLTRARERCLTVMGERYRARGFRSRTPGRLSSCPRLVAA